MIGDGYGFGYMLSILPLSAGLVLLLSYRGYRFGEERQLYVFGVVLILVSIFLIVDEYRLIKQKEDQFEVSYLAYRAYDDHLISESEYEVLSGIGLSEELYRDLNTDDVSVVNLREYEVLVNDAIKDFDDSDGHLVFKLEVLRLEKDVFWDALDDGAISDQEESLAFFAHDVLKGPGVVIGDSLGVSDVARLRGELSMRYRWFNEEELLDDSVRLKGIEERDRVLKLVD